MDKVMLRSEAIGGDRWGCPLSEAEAALSTLSSGPTLVLILCSTSDKASWPLRLCLIQRHSSCLPHHTSDPQASFGVFEYTVILYPQALSICGSLCQQCVLSFKTLSIPET